MDEAEHAAHLPAEIGAAIQAIRDDRDHGASWLARAAARSLLQSLDWPSDGAASDAWMALARATAQALATSRPSMAAVANTAARIWSVGQGESPAEARTAMRSLATRLSQQDVEEQHALLANAEKLVAGTVYTLSRSGTVEAALRALGGQRVVERVLVAESRPGGEGIALARVLAKHNIPVTLLADAACGIFIGEADCVLLGADSLRADGSLVNKVGAYPLALAAREVGKPVYALCETLKIAAPQFPLILEAGDPRELLREPIPGLEARNPAFDVTPAALLAAYITEVGVLDRDAVARQAEAAGQALAALQLTRNYR